MENKGVLLKKIGLVFVCVIFTYITVKYIIPSHNLNPLLRNVDEEEIIEVLKRHFPKRHHEAIKKTKLPNILQTFHGNYPNTYFLLMVVYYILYISITIYTILYLLVGQVYLFEFVLPIILFILIFTYFSLPYISWIFYYIFLIIFYGSAILIGGYVLYFILKILSGFISGQFPNLSDVIRLSPKVFLCDIQSSYKKLKEGSIPSSILYIFLFQILLLASYFSYPYLKHFIQFRSSTVLLSKPIYLNYKKQIGSLLNMEKTHLNSFGLTFDFFIHQTGEMFESSNEKDILQYGNYPRITYDTYDGIFRIYLKRGTKNSELGTKDISLCTQETIVKVYENEDVPLQRWHNITVNYDHGILDVFMNHELIVTRRDLIPCVHESIISVGDENGLEGGIKNVYYKNNPISNI